MNNEIGFFIGLTIFFCLCALPSILNIILMPILRKEKDDDFVIPLQFDNENNICIFHNDTIIIYYSKNDLSIIKYKLNQPKGNNMNKEIYEDNSNEILRLAKELKDIIEHNNQYRHVSQSEKELCDHYVRNYRKMNKLIESHILDQE